ncbi:hypothetical protein AGLY_011253 [Aphis glycines]|uniref:Uncharacterized protein n=1 Tax=Aphis glycines TaxID=307491 RepID=A0A6G0TF23_APHGL|nr:hypothetical protein AGLY_011253 [Aphis glycines]
MESTQSSIEDSYHKKFMMDPMQQRHIAIEDGTINKKRFICVYYIKSNNLLDKYVLIVYLDSIKSRNYMSEVASIQLFKCILAVSCYILYLSVCLPYACVKVGPFKDKREPSNSLFTNISSNLLSISQHCLLKIIMFCLMIRQHFTYNYIIVRSQIIFAQGRGIVEGQWSSRYGPGTGELDQISCTNLYYFDNSVTKAFMIHKTLYIYLQQNYNFCYLPVPTLATTSSPALNIHIKFEN